MCNIFTDRALSIGMRNDDVRGLQEFLRSEGALSAEATGYFGVATREALRKWQVSNSVIAANASAGAGMVGPRTREALLRRCGNSGALSVAPQVGRAPLTVTVTSKIGDDSDYRPSIADGQDTLIDFGDGSERQWVQCDTVKNDQFGGLHSGGTCQNPQHFKHTYEKDGTYTVRLLQAGGMCIGGCPERLLGSAHVTVGERPVACTKEYKPVCGMKQVQCITTPCNPVSQTYGNRCTMQADGATFAYEGECTDSGNRPPVISGISGPTRLNLNEVGTWSVTASDPENGQLTYSIVWGDEWYANDTAARLSSPSYSIIQSTTFTHAYGSAGTYRVQVSVKDSGGKTAQSSATVTVGTTAYCTMEYAPVCGQPPEPACRRSIPACLMATPGPTTYSNTCMLRSAGAEYLYAGVCR